MRTDAAAPVTLFEVKRLTQEGALVDHSYVDVLILITTVAACGSSGSLSPPRID
jgi:hypothetical protein